MLDHGWHGVGKVHIVVVFHCVVPVQNVVVKVRVLMDAMRGAVLHSFARQLA